MKCTCLFRHPETQNGRKILGRIMADHLAFAKDLSNSDMDRSAAKTAAAVLYVRLYTPCDSVEAAR